MILDIRNLDFKYDKKKVLKNISFSAASGELIMLIGPNGSGKSTLLKCISSYLKADNGEIKIYDRSISSYQKNKLAELIAYVPQQKEYNFPMTVFEAVLMGRKPYSSWAASERDKEITAEIIAELNLEDIAFTNINKLSGGQKQKVYLARAAAQESQIILLDEPTNNLDLKHQLELFQLIKKEAVSGKTIIITMHDLGLVSRFGERIIILKEGEIFSDGDKGSLTAEKINDVYGVEVSLKEHNGNQFIIPEKIVV
ncbi:MAG: ABC transporter ATP-binding protein [Halanaerobium sp.]